MAISTLQASLLTRLYSFVRRTGILETHLGQNTFVKVYFIYKRYIEDPFSALAQRHPELFAAGHILDVGANIGYTASVFSQAANASSQVYAFEPEPFNFHLLERGAVSKHLGATIVPIHAAVGDHEGSIDLWLNDQHHADHRIATNTFKAEKHSARFVSVPLTSIDAFVRAHSLEGKIGFIKIDVQGYEYPVCVGMNETLLANKNVAVALEYMPGAMQELGFDGTALLTWFRQRGFRVYSLRRNGLLEPGICDDLSRCGYTDLLFSQRSLT